MDRSKFGGKMLEVFVGKKKYLAIMCSFCNGDGIVQKCLKPEVHSDTEYKDSFQQKEAETDHEHILEVCKCCKGLCVVLVPVNNLTVLSHVSPEVRMGNNDDDTPERVVVNP